MALITNPQIKNFCNEKARVIADLIEKTRRTCEQFMIEIVAVEQNPAYSEAENGDVIDDGADVDGREIVTKGDLAALKYVVEQLAIAANADDRETTVARWSVNGTPAF